MINCTSSELIFNYGVMNSAKTVNLICKAYELKQKGFRSLCLKPSIDTRSETNLIRSRAGLTIEAVEIKDTKHLKDTLESSIKLKYSYILIDEIQFFKEEDIDLLCQFSLEYNISILCYGLMTDFQTKMFPASKRLVELADELHHIQSYCGCGNIATINARIDKNGNIIIEGNQIEIGAEDKYMTLCKSCFYKSYDEHDNIFDKINYLIIGDNTKENRHWLINLGYIPLEPFLNKKFIYTSISTRANSEKGVWKEFNFETHDVIKEVINGKRYINCVENNKLFKLITERNKNKIR